MFRCVTARYVTSGLQDHRAFRSPRFVDFTDRSGSDDQTNMQIAILVNAMLDIVGLPLQNLHTQLRHGLYACDSTETSEVSTLVSAHPARSEEVVSLGRNYRST
jgi:hypothetical protein